MDQAIATYSKLTSQLTVTTVLNEYEDETVTVGIYVGIVMTPAMLDRALEAAGYSRNGDWRNFRHGRALRATVQGL